MDLSIITSLYKSEKYIKRYYKSLKRTTNYLIKHSIAFELIIIANEPNNFEENYINKIEKNIKNVKTIRVARESLYASWNRGIRESSGKAICFWNVDDIRFGRAIIDGVEKIKAGVDIVYFPFIILKKHKYYKYFPIMRVFVEIPDEFSKTRNREGMLCGPFFIINRSSFRKIGYFDEQFKVCGDYDWCIRAGDNNLIFVKSKRFGGLYIKHGNTLSGGKENIIHKIENEIIYRRYNLKHKFQKLNIIEENILNKYNIFKKDFI